jgi:inorganic pyrophosphatase
MPATHRFHPWHDVPTGPKPPELLTAIVEIPRHSRNKYELDKELGLFRLDRLLHSAVQFPGDYGFLPRTLGDDGDPLDVLVIMTMPVFTGCLVEVRPVGIFHLVDRKANDEKIIAVPTNDPFASEIQDIGDLRAHSLREIEHFFEVYKDLEGARVRSRGFEGRLSAGKAILAAMANYERAFGKKARRADGQTVSKPAAKPTRRPAKAVPKKKGPR